MDKALFKFIFSSIPHFWIFFAVVWFCQPRILWIGIAREEKFVAVHGFFYGCTCATTLLTRFPSPQNGFMILMLFSEKKYFFSRKIGKGALAHANALTYRAITPPVPPPEPPAMDKKIFYNKGKNAKAARGADNSNVTQSSPMVEPMEWNYEWKKTTTNLIKINMFNNIIKL